VACAPRFGHIAAYDAGHRLMIVHGQETAMLDEWSDAYGSRSMASPSGVRVRRAEVFGTPRRSMRPGARAFFSGARMGTATWTYSFDTQAWSEIRSEGSPCFNDGAAPPVQSVAAMSSRRLAAGIELTYLFKLSPWAVS
jgi:hypothetical protein